MPLPMNVRSEPYYGSGDGAVFQPEHRRLLVFGLESILVLHTWERLRALRFYPETQTCRGCRPDLDLESLGLASSMSDSPPTVWLSRSRRAWAHYFESIPIDVRRRAARFPQSQWSVLALERRVPGAGELVESNPALGFALANAWALCHVHRPFDLARRSIARRRRAIAEVLGFPGTEAVVRILAKVAVESLSVERLSALRELLRTGHATAIQWLYNLARINAGVIHLLSDESLRSRVTYGFVEEVSRRRRDDEIPFVVWGLAPALQRLTDSRCLLGSLAELKALTPQPRALDELTKTARLRDAPLVPPIPSNDRVIELRTDSELKTEGLAMRSCLRWRSKRRAYLRRISGGRFALYRVERPRATLSLELVEGAWRISELFGPGNAVPTARLMRVVAHWLGAYPDVVLPVGFAGEPVWRMAAAEDEIPF